MPKEEGIITSGTVKMLGAQLALDIVHDLIESWELTLVLFHLVTTQKPSICFVCGWRLRAQIYVLTFIIYKLEN
jgi:hypothetical protein